MKVISRSKKSKNKNSSRLIPAVFQEGDVETDDVVKSKIKDNR